MEKQEMMEKPVLKIPFGETPMPFSLFVSLSRDAATSMTLPAFCRLRRCARIMECQGKLKRREIPPGLSAGKDFTAWLPLCIAGADDLWLLGFIDYWYYRRDQHFGRPIRPPEAEPEIPPLYEEWPHADDCLLDALPRFLNPGG